MNDVAKTIVFLLIVTLSGCFDNSTGSDSDPPEIKSLSPERLSVLDTLTVKFTEKIDTSEIQLNVRSGSFDYTFKNEQELLIFGTATTINIKHFVPGSAPVAGFDNIADYEGNENNELEKLELDIYPWFDKDYFENEYTGADTLQNSTNPSQWLDGSGIGKTLISEGVIMTGANRQVPDIHDYKVVFLNPDDKIEVALNCPKNRNLSLQLFGPYEKSNFDEVINSNEFSDPPPEDLRWFNQKTESRGKVEGLIEIDSKRHKLELGTYDEAVYIIRIAPDRLEDQAFYRLSTSITLFP